MSAKRIARVVLDSPLPQFDQLFDYAVPERLQGVVRVGQRIKVAVRHSTRTLDAYIVELTDQSEFSGTVREFTDLVSEICFLTEETLALLRAVADRAVGTVGDLLRFAVPPRQSRTEQSVLNVHPLETWASQLDAYAEHARSSARHETTREAVRTAQHPVRLSNGEWAPCWASDVAKRACAAFDSGESVIVTVPDSFDLDSLRQALEAEAGERHVVRLDARQAPAVRYRQFLDMRRSDRSIVIGNRSAVYAPVNHLGLIIMWDDADPSYSEPLAPYAHARDVAILRSRLSGCDLALYSNVASLPTHRLITLGYLTESVTPSPRRTAVLTELQTHTDVFEPRIPSSVLAAIKAAVQHGPVLVQVAFTGESFAADDDRAVESSSPKTVSGTAELLRRQFANIDVVTSTGAERRTLVSSKPAVIVATRGAEPLCAEGYTLAVMLDARAQVSAVTLNAEHEALRYWSNAAALCRPDATIYVVGTESAVGRAFALHNESAWLTDTLTQLRQLGYPPAVRVASLSGDHTSLEHVLTRLQSDCSAQIVLRDVKDSLRVAVIRFSYDSGDCVAATLRTAVLEAAKLASRRQPGPVRSVTKLRVHMDDAEAFDERASGRRVEVAT